MAQYKPSGDEVEKAKTLNQNIDEDDLGGYDRATPDNPHGDPATWQPELWEWLYDELAVRSVMDVGCGEGHSTEYFKDLGCDVLGIDGSLQAKQNSRIPGFHVIHDFKNGPYVPPKRYDLIWCCEFVEHVDEKYAKNFLKTFTYSDRYIVMTHALPSQGGWHHVNCRNSEYWIAKICRLGFMPDVDLTFKARRVAKDKFFGKSGLIFKRCNRLAGIIISWTVSLSMLLFCFKPAWNLMKRLLRLIYPQRAWQ